LCKETNFCVILLSGMLSNEYLGTARFVENVDRQFDSLNIVSCDSAGKELWCPLNDKSPHVGYWPCCLQMVTLTSVIEFLEECVWQPLL
jgi:hypothetical protein